MDNNNSPRKNTESDDLFLDIARARHENASHIREEATRQIPVVHRGASKSAQAGKTAPAIGRRKAVSPDGTRGRSAGQSAAAGQNTVPRRQQAHALHSRRRAPARANRSRLPRPPHLTAWHSTAFRQRRTAQHALSRGSNAHRHQARQAQGLPQRAAEASPHPRSAQEAVRQAAERPARQDTARVRAPHSPQHSAREARGADAKARIRSTAERRSRAL